MDYKHDEFLEILSEVQSCNEDEFIPLFEKMIEHTREHFNAEEEIMRTYDFYDRRDHFLEHENLLNEMEYFYTKSIKIPNFGRSYVNEYAYEKFKRHILNIDSQLAMFLKNNSIA
ncbi:hemerythrin family protein [bacterium]|nr:hemerythrin family protein [bacterium]MBU1990227.1 hemerythrin family protein [bacterium]